MSRLGKGFDCFEIFKKVQVVNMKIVRNFHFWPEFLVSDEKYKPKLKSLNFKLVSDLSRVSILPRG